MTEIPDDPEALREIITEHAAFTKHVGAATFAEARDVLFRSCAQYQDAIAEQFDQIKTVAKERDEARTALAAASAVFDKITQALTEERKAALARISPPGRSEPTAMSTRNKPKVITWDWKEQPDWDDVNLALVEQIDAFVHPVDTQSDQYAIVIGPRAMTSTQAQARYEEWWNAGTEEER